MTDKREWVLSHNHVTGQYVVGPEGEDGVVVPDSEQGLAIVTAHNATLDPAPVSTTTINTVEELADLVKNAPSTPLAIPDGEPHSAERLLGSIRHMETHGGLRDPENWLPATVLVPAPATTGTEACESGNSDCGAVVWHDGDGTAMCAKCLIATVAENTAALSARPATDDTEREAVDWKADLAKRNPGGAMRLTLHGVFAAKHIALVPDEQAEYAQLLDDLADAALSAIRPAPTDTEREPLTPDEMERISAVVHQGYHMPEVFDVVADIKRAALSAIRPAPTETEPVDVEMVIDWLAEAPGSRHETTACDEIESSLAVYNDDEWEALAEYLVGKFSATRPATVSTVEGGEALHHLAVVVDDGYPSVTLTCDAAKGAQCRRRPTDPDVEQWGPGYDGPMEDAECWAVEWVQDAGLDGLVAVPDARHLVSESPLTIGRFPVSVHYDEGVVATLLTPVARPTVTAGEVQDAVTEALDGEFSDTWTEGFSRNVVTHLRAAGLDVAP